MVVIVGGDVVIVVGCAKCWLLWEVIVVGGA